MSARGHRIKVREVVSETAETVSLIFDIPPNLSRRFAYFPGQFLTLRVPSERTGSVARCYSLSSSPHCGDRPTVTVKRTPGGYASNWICDNVVAGSILEVLEPAGNFVPRNWNRDLLLCAAGSGITPIMSILKSALSTGRSRVVLLYANRDRGSTIFARQLRELVRRYPRRLTVLHWLESERGVPTVRGLAGLTKPYRGYEVYLCGPSGFALVAEQTMAQLRVSARAVHREEYRSLTENPFEQPAPAPMVTTAVRPAVDTASVRVDIDGETHRLPWPRGKKLLDLLLEHGIDAPYVCRESACGTCVCRVERGRTRMLVNEALIDEELALGLTLACQTLPESDDLHITFDQ
ncbi:2Fe-2S iron-sulfur cluster binding domain-containing protein [Nocardia sp. SYP-A9097]|uniref:2Fe-2S iron-sulfur cluster-binding protein n=1 Tax=Nocardia sp. SYP-A9097 TaxID=2663237 RepID=UPI00129B3971|nr:2Fe-2S iron-sulfur cluster-binding protein [Nocardia sp. SYP-A9097]MRH90832.1 2Fe-2S iron-sulfur cluster binding domain-containing protein [Nocardia sp. SYP-A9097]